MGIAADRADAANRRGADARGETGIGAAPRELAVEAGQASVLRRRPIGIEQELMPWAKLPPECAALPAISIAIANSQCLVTCANFVRGLFKNAAHPPLTVALPSLTIKN